MHIGYFVSDTAVIRVNDTTLMANDANATYQWLSCISGRALSSARSRSFTPGISGRYAVVVTNGHCSDTSDCWSVVLPTPPAANVSQLTRIASIVPNPTSGAVNITLDGAPGNIRLDLQDMAGKTLSTTNISGTRSITLDLGRLASGIYLVTLTDESGRTERQKLVRN